MEIVTIKLTKQKLEELTKNGSLQFNEFEVKIVDVKEFDYNASEAWLMQKQKADKEFKKLKEIEFNIRNK